MAQAQAQAFVTNPAAQQLAALFTDPKAMQLAQILNQPDVQVVVKPKLSKKRNKKVVATVKDAAYFKRRAKNNACAKKCRAQKKMQKQLAQQKQQAQLQLLNMAQQQEFSQMALQLALSSNGACDE